MQTALNIHYSRSISITGYYLSVLYSKHCGRRPTEKDLLGLLICRDTLSHRDVSRSWYSYLQSDCYNKLTQNIPPDLLVSHINCLKLSSSRLYSHIIYRMFTFAS